jgi:HK97 family phage prohead protease
MDTERRLRRMAMRGVPERLGFSFSRGDMEMRAKPNGTAAGSSFEFNGYAAVYDAPFDMWDPWGEPYTESVAQGACKRALDNPHLDVPFLIGHNDSGVPLARTKSGTMKLSEDSHGLHVHVPSMDGSREEVRALASAVKRGDMTEMSLAFICNQQQWDESFERRTVAEMDIHRGDVCAVTHGANAATAGASMFPVEQLSLRRPVAIGGPHLLELRMPTAPYTVNPGEDTPCPQCQSANDGNACFCDQCGARMPGEPGASTVTGEDESQQCQACLSMNATDAKFCDQCGSGLAGVRPWMTPGGLVGMDWSDGRLREQLSVTAAERDKAKDAGNSLPDGSYPINNVKQLKAAAVLAASKHGDWKAAQSLIRRRAKELGVDVTTLAGFGEAKAAGGPLERRASANESLDLSSASDYDAAAAGHAAAGLTCPKCGAGNHGGSKFCGQCGHGFADGVATSASMMVDDSTGIPGPETQFSAGARLEQLMRELDLEELAGRHQAA